MLTGLLLKTSRVNSYNVLILREQFRRLCLPTFQSWDWMLMSVV
ncbi:unnamed protein product, partial [Brassica rapa subsp. trilocularis]